MITPRVTQRENESRKEYLIRAAIVMLENSAYRIESVDYDDANCDAYCLIQDLKIEFDIE